MGNTSRTAAARRRTAMPPASGLKRELFQGPGEVTPATRRRTRAGRKQTSRAAARRASASSSPGAPVVSATSGSELSTAFKRLKKAAVSSGLSKFFDDFQGFSRISKDFLEFSQGFPDVSGSSRMRGRRASLCFGRVHVSRTSIYYTHIYIYRII